jgi:pimeloyl-ACP methyl ester carboxylesterase
MTMYPGAVTGQVTVDGVDVRYVDSGPIAGSDHTFVLVHGTGGSAERSFWTLFPMIATRHRVVALDLHDREPGKDALTLDWLVRQVRAVVETVAPDGAAVLGHSLGAVVAAKLAAQHPELVKYLVLVAGWAATDQHQLLRNSVWQSLYDAKHPALAEFMTLTAHSPFHLNALNEAEFTALVDQARNAPDRSAAMALNRTIDIREDLPSIQAPTLIVACSHDWMAPVHHSHLLFGGIANSCFAEVPSGHAVMLERPAEVFRLAHDLVTGAPKFIPGAVLEAAHA